ncbi:hypothetical protein GCM10017044_25070 [Kordiimonas sediminis]|uniref:Uncharacterized protein n=2 Tax=Kordiimonas sediminis TaxID=1735581 RepID=A0A919E9Z7_9PROT|nr:hypothetical protein GCM10017044_25070 [Kordiimonas sediminis]
MLLEMVPDMPDIAEDTYEWAPKSYPQHFLDSGFAAKDLAVEAYELAPTSIRKAFDITCQHLDDFLVATVSGLKTLNVAERGLTENASMLIKSRVQQVQEELAKLNAIIHGKVDEFVDEATSKTIIAAKESTNIKDDDRDAAHTQEEIDALFD